MKNVSTKKLGSNKLMDKLNISSKTCISLDLSLQELKAFPTLYFVRITFFYNLGLSFSPSNELKEEAKDKARIQKQEVAQIQKVVFFTSTFKREMHRKHKQ